MIRIKQDDAITKLCPFMQGDFCTPHCMAWVDLGQPKEYALPQAQGSAGKFPWPFKFKSTALIRRNELNAEAGYDAWEIEERDNNVFFVSRLLDDHEMTCVAMPGGNDDD